MTLWALLRGRFKGVRIDKLNGNLSRVGKQIEEKLSTNLIEKCRVRPDATKLGAYYTDTFA